MKDNYFLEIFQEALKRRQTYLQKNQLEAYRLICRDEFNLPFAVDIYGQYAVIHFFEEFPLEGLEKALTNLLDITTVFYKDRTKEHNIKLPKSEHTEITVTEYGHKFLINLSDYLDLGLFLDHRETRKMVQEQSKDKIVLNTFAYTGSFSIYAAKGGAKKTYSVDLSKTYCDWIRKNLQLNNLSEEQNWIYKMDTLEFFRYAKRKNLQFDIIIIDPPTFSRNKTERFSVQKNHFELLQAAAEVLEKSGFIIFSNNCLSFELDRKAEENFLIEDLTETTLPTDFQIQIESNESASSLTNWAIPIHNCFLLKKKL